MYKSDAVEITVVAPTVKVKSTTFDKVAVGATIKLESTVANAGDATVEYTVDDEEKATVDVDEDGTVTVTGVAEGTVTITATITVAGEKYEDEIEIDVYAPLEDEAIDLSKAEAVAFNGNQVNTTAAYDEESKVLTLTTTSG